MGEIVNLRRARKAKARQRDEEQAAQNRVAFGLSKAEKQFSAATRALDAKKLDGHLRDDSAPQHDPNSES